MHIVIGVLSAMAGLIWAIAALQKSGFNLDTVNPFLWRRRTQWKMNYGVLPVYNLGDPMEVAAVLVLGVAKCEGEISAEQKKAILNLFADEFRLDHNESADLLLASSHLIRNEVYLVDNLEKILAKSQSGFTPQQVESMLSMMHRIGSLENGLNEEQQKLITVTAKHYGRHTPAQGPWH